MLANSKKTDAMSWKKDKIWALTNIIIVKISGKLVKIKK